MELSPALTNDLTKLSAALDNAETIDIARVLTDLAGDLSASLTAEIPDYLGLTIAVHLGGIPIMISTLTEEDASEVGGSLLLTLQATGAAATTGTLTFYSDRTGAFADLADSTRWIFNLNSRPVQDAPQTRPDPTI